ncbi:MAG: hypothetical protein LBF02_00895 [Mycoplasmataceae bacterium]|nr:hypothetical protein [Mycoplasmataceae bacterium]
MAKLLKKGSIIGDKRTHGTKNIKFFWSSTRYFKENVYHCIASSCILVFCTIVLVFLIVCFSLNIPFNSLHKIPKWMLGFSIPLFILLLTFIVCKINESKVKKIRIYELNSTLNREITIGSNK